MVSEKWGSLPHLSGHLLDSARPRRVRVKPERSGQLVTFWVCLWIVCNAFGRVAGSYRGDPLGRSVSNSGAVGSGRRGRGRVGRLGWVVNTGQRYGVYPARSRVSPSKFTTQHPRQYRAVCPTLHRAENRPPVVNNRDYVCYVP
jgi:hypothetical protein